MQEWLPSHRHGYSDVNAAHGSCNSRYVTVERSPLRSYCAGNGSPHTGMANLMLMLHTAHATATTVERTHPLVPAYRSSCREWLPSHRHGYSDANAAHGSCNSHYSRHGPISPPPPPPPPKLTGVFGFTKESSGGMIPRLMT